MKNLNRLKLIPVMLVAMSSALGAFGQQPQPPKTSAESSRSSDTRASEVRVTPSEKLPSLSKKGWPDSSGRGGGTAKAVTLTAACNAAADELGVSRILIDALETENAALRSRLETEKRANDLLTELNETRRAENEAMKATVAAKNETIAAKDAAIAAQEKLIEQLKGKKRSPWSRVADILLGAAVIAILK